MKTATPPKGVTARWVSRRTTRSPESKAVISCGTGLSGVFTSTTLYRRHLGRQYSSISEFRLRGPAGVSNVDREKKRSLLTASGSSCSGETRTCEDQQKVGRRESAPGQRERRAAVRFRAEATAHFQLWGGPLVRGRPPGRPFGTIRNLTERDRGSRADQGVRPTNRARRRTRRPVPFPRDRRPPRCTRRSVDGGCDSDGGRGDGPAGAG